MTRVLSILMMRVLFGGLLGFEVANYFRVFRFQIVYTWLGLILTALVVWAALEYLHRRSERRLHALAWALVALAVFFDFAGEMFGWYATLPYYDKAAHAFGGAAAVGALLLYYTSGGLKPSATNTLKVSLGQREVIRALALVQAAGMLYELEEFTEDALTLSHRWGGWYDSAGDVAANIAGALAVLVVMGSLRLFRAGQSSGGHDTPTTQLG